jgi:hypothetical protein
VRSSSGKSRSRLLTISIVVVLVCSAVLAAENVLSIGFSFERNYNEGWNVYNAQRLIEHQLVYDENYWRVNNYPIVSFVIVAALNVVVDDLLLSGRIVALVSFIAVGALAALVTRRLGGTRSAAALSGGCALGFYYLVAPAWIAVDDPQSLAEALMLAGFATYVGGPPTRRTLLGTALLVMVAGFTKHNLVAIPLAISLDLALRWPRRLPFWLASCAGFGVAFLGLTYLVAGGAFLDHLLSPRVFDWYNVHYHLMKFVRLLKIPLTLTVLFSWRIFSRDRLVVAGYGLIAVVASALLSGYEGVSYNMFQDPAVFLAIASGLMLHELRNWMAAGKLGTSAPAKIAGSLAPALLALPILTAAAKTVDHVFRSEDWLTADRTAEQSFAADAAYLAQRRGPKICESLLLCYRSGEPFTLDPFNSRQYILAGKLDQSDLIRRVAAQEFAAIQLRADICDDQTSSACHILHYPRKFNRFTDDFLYSVDRSYRIDRRSQFGVIYIPK